MLVAESVFTWDMESFVDLCFDVVSKIYGEFLVQGCMGLSSSCHSNHIKKSIPFPELISLLKVRNSSDSYHYTMEQHFISTAGTLKMV